MKVVTGGLKWGLKNVVIYPVLFAVNEILLLAAPNMANVALAETISPILLLSGFASVLLLVLGRIYKSMHRAGLVTLVFLLWFDRYGLIAQLVDALPGIEVRLVQHVLLFILWTAFFGIFVSPWVWKKVTAPQIITQYFNLLVLILLVFSLYRLASYRMGRLEPKAATEMLPEVLELSGRTQPDIYYIIADGYGRQDVMLELYDLDDSEFFQALEQRGFYVAQQSHSNYIRTLLSLSSSLNLSYLPKLPQDSADVGPLQEMMGNNLVQRSLAASGYQTFILNSGIFLDPQRVLEGLFWLNSVAALPIDANLIPPPMPKNKEQQAVIMGQTAQLKDIAGIPGPKYVFMHILVPHPPFIFDRNGPINSERVYRLSDGENFPGTPDEYIQGYREQLLYVNELLIPAIDAILENNPTPPIIIVQGDHGGGAYLDPSGLEKSCVRERFSILNAYYLPGFPDEQLYPRVTPVNSFRLIFNFYFNADLELLPDESYYSPAQLPYQLTQVTDLVDQPCQIP